MTDSNNHFRSVLRGYDPVQVDRHVSELAQVTAAARDEAAERAMAVSRLETVQEQLRSEVERHANRARALEEAQTKAVTPTYTALGERIGSILTLADKEAGDLRTRAAADAASKQELAKDSALATRRDADRYSRETRAAADVEAARSLEDARRQADSTLEDADRQGAVRREEAEALYELARAKCATEAVDFESTLAARKEASSLQFAAEVAAAEQQLSALRLQSEASRIESEQARQEAGSRSAEELEQAKTQARKLVAEAKVKAEHIRSDSERELAAATQRRDSINVQLSNVRQMIAALGGSPIIEALEPPETQPANPKGVTPAAWQPKEVKPAAWRPSSPKDVTPAAWQATPATLATPSKALPPVIASDITVVLPIVAGQPKKGARDTAQAGDATHQRTDDKGHDQKPDPRQAAGAKS